MTAAGGREISGGCAGLLRIPLTWVVRDRDGERRFWYQTAEQRSACRDVYFGGGGGVNAVTLCSDLEETGPRGPGRLTGLTRAQTQTDTCV